MGIHADGNRKYSEPDDVTERVVLATLSLLLMIGALLLHVSRSMPMAEIKIQRGYLQESMSIYSLEEKLKEARRVAINTASAEDITVIPGIGPVLAARIVQYREDNGKFFSPEDLLDVRGIGPVKLEGIRGYIKID